MDTQDPFSAAVRQPSFHSRFGGMWIDRHDFDQEIQRRLAAGRLAPRLEQPVRSFARDGYLVLPGAAAEADLVRFEQAISKAFSEGHRHLVGQQPGDGTPRRVVAGMDPRQVRIVDCFAVLPEAMALFSSPSLAEFLACVLDERPLLFQSISFEVGSQQGLHQDTAYVVVDKRPMELVACWIALEDVKAGSGELQYMVGSHRLPDFEFGGNKKHWDSAVDGLDKHAEWFEWILREGQAREMPTERFLARRGDILVWHADLAHGGSPIVDASLSRKSLVGHYCPTSATPYFMKIAPARAMRLNHGAVDYASWYYDLTRMQSEAARDEFVTGLFGEAAPQP